MTGGFPALIPTGPASSGSCNIYSPALPHYVGKNCLQCTWAVEHGNGLPSPWLLGTSGCQPQAECSQLLSSSNPVTRPFALHQHRHLPVCLRLLPSCPAGIASLRGLTCVGGGGGGCCHCTIQARTEGCPHVAPGRRAVRSGIFQPKSFFKWGKKTPFGFLDLLGNSPAKLSRSKSFFFLKSECFISIFSSRMPQQQCQSFLPF